MTVPCTMCNMLEGNIKEQAVTLMRNIQLAYVWKASL